jgi:hypothetical protein
MHAASPLLDTLAVTRPGVVTAGLVRPIPAVVGMVTHFCVSHTLVVGALELVKHAWPRTAGTDRHVVLVAGVGAVLDAITHLILGDTLSIPALELVHLLTGEVVTERWTLISAIPAIVDLVTEVSVPHTQVVPAFQLVVRAIFPIREARLAVQLVRHVVTVLVAVTLQLLLDAVTRGTLESAGITRVVFAVILVSAVSTIIVVVALPSGWDAFIIVTFQF